MTQLSAKPELWTSFSLGWQRLIFYSPPRWKNCMKRKGEKDWCCVLCYQRPLLTFSKTFAQCSISCLTQPHAGCRQRCWYKSMRKALQRLNAQQSQFSRGIMNPWRTFSPSQENYWNSALLDLKSTTHKYTNALKQIKTTNYMQVYKHENVCVCVCWARCLLFISSCLPESQSSKAKWSRTYW